MRTILRSVLVFLLLPISFLYAQQNGEQENQSHYNPLSMQAGHFLKKADAVLLGNVSDVAFNVDEHGVVFKLVSFLVEGILYEKSNTSFEVGSKYEIYVPTHILDGPELPEFKLGEQVILSLKDHEGVLQLSGNWFGKYEITGSKIEDSEVFLSEFQEKVKSFLAGENQLLSLSESFFERMIERRIISNGANNQIGPGKNSATACTNSSPISKLGGGFLLLNPVRRAEESNTIEFKINPAGAKNETGGTLGFSSIKSAIQRAVDSWNNSPHSFDTFSISSTSTSAARGQNNGTSTITFAPLSFNGTTYMCYNTSTGLLTEIDIVFDSDNWWNTSTTYPDDWSTNQHPEHGAIGPVDLENVAAHELGHGVGLAHPVNANCNGCTMVPTDYSSSNWWENTARRSLEDKDKAGKTYLDPSFSSSSSQSISHVLLAAQSDVSMSGTLTVPSGKTFEVEAGKTLKFNSSASVFSNGKVKMKGTSSNRITLEKSGSSRWNYLYLKGSGTNGSEIEYVDLSGSWYGIHTNNTSASVVLKDVTSTGNYYQGLKLYNSSGITVNTGSKFNSNTNYGVYVDNTDNASFRGGTEFKNNSSWGIGVRGNSTAYFGASNESADAEVTGNTNYGLNVYLDSYLEIGNDATNFGGDNNVHSNGSYNARALSGGEIKAELTWWGANPPNTSKFSGISDIDYQPYLSSAAKTTDFNSEPLESPAQFVKEVHDLAIENRGVAKDYLVNSLNHQNSLIAKKAKMLYARELLNEVDPSEGILFAEALLDSKDFSEAEKSIIAKQLFYTYLLDQNDHVMASERFYLLEEMKDDDIENGLLEVIYEEITGKHPSDHKRLTASIERQELVVENYPNPFNPSTIISFTLTTKAHVTLSIFDVLGRKVHDLVDEIRDAGTHESVFDGTKLGSGVYFYRLTANNHVLSGKMHLLK